MFKVMIIDDEPIIRKGLRNILNWKQFDCTICAEASDGEEGKNLIRIHRPDILITDIRMPETDGLAMIREVREEVPDCKMIVLTGYRDFDYVQEAIKLGVFDFVLKPTKIEELTAVVGKAVSDLKCMRSRSQELQKLRGLFEQNIPVLREKLLYDILCEIYTKEDEVLSKTEILGVHIDHFILLVVEIDSEEDKRHNLYDRQLYQFGIINTFGEIFQDRYESMSISTNDNATAFLLNLSGKEDKHAQVINEKCAYLQDMVSNCFGFTVTIAVSTEGRGIMHLPGKYKECREALEHKFYIGNNSVIFHDDLNGFIQFEDYSVLEKHQKLLIEGIKTGNEKTVTVRLEEIFNYIRCKDQINMEYMKSFYLGTITYINNIRLSVAQADSEKQAESLHTASLHKMIEESKSVEELNFLLKEASLGVTARIHSFNHKNIKLILRKAMDYLQDHYTEQITLNEVADSIYVSTSYISRMFKKELGINFVDYLNGIRMDKAKELLKDPKYKTYEVAEMVGILDAHYFSRLFKKHEGLTPTEYRDL